MVAVTKSWWSSLNCIWFFLTEDPRKSWLAMEEFSLHLLQQLSHEEQLATYPPFFPPTVVQDISPLVSVNCQTSSASICHRYRWLIISISLDSMVHALELGRLESRLAFSLSLWRLLLHLQECMHRAFRSHLSSPTPHILFYCIQPVLVTWHQENEARRDLFGARDFFFTPPEPILHHRALFVRSAACTGSIAWSEQVSQPRKSLGRYVDVHILLLLSKKLTASLG